MEPLLLTGFIVIVFWLITMNKQNTELKKRDVQITQLTLEAQRLKNSEQQARKELKHAQELQEKEQIEQDEIDKIDERGFDYIEIEDWNYGVLSSLKFFRESDFARELNFWKSAPNLAMITPDLFAPVQIIFERITIQAQELEYFLNEFRNIRKQPENKNRKDFAQFSRNRLAQIKREYHSLAELAPELLRPVRLELEGLIMVDKMIDTVYSYINQYEPEPISFEPIKFEEITDEQLRMERKKKISYLRVLLKELKIQLPETLD